MAWKKLSTVLDDFMPARIEKISTGADALIHTCEICQENAYFGVDISYRRALNEREKGNLGLAQEFLGKWYCLIHWREHEKENA
jgi:hypothetical protein